MEIKATILTLFFHSIPPAAAPAPLFGAFGGTAAPAFGASAPASSDAPAPPAGGLFGAPPAATGGALFGAPATGGGLFGAPAPAGGLFGAAPATGTTTAPLFSFGGGAAAAAPAAADDDDDGPLDDGEKTEAALDTGAAIAFKTKAKMHAQGVGPDGKPKWAERGSGALTVRTPADARPHLVLTTDTGRVVLNAAIYKGMTAIKAKKPHIVAVNLANAAPPPPSVGGGDGEGDTAPAAADAAAAAPKLAPHLLSFDSEPSADAFIEAVKKAEAGV